MKPRAKGAVHDSSTGKSYRCQVYHLELEQDGLERFSCYKCDKDVCWGCLKLYYGFEVDWAVREGSEYVYPELAKAWERVQK